MITASAVGLIQLLTLMPAARKRPERRGEILAAGKLLFRLALVLEAETREKKEEEKSRRGVYPGD